jgi:hypothetical protein
MIIKIKTTVIPWSVTLPQLPSITVTLWVLIPCCVNHPATWYPLKEAGWTGGPSKRSFRVCGLLLVPHIAVGSLSSSPVAGILRNKPTYIYTIYMLMVDFS